MTGGQTVVCDGSCLGKRGVLAACPGLTYRQLDYWTTAGLVAAHRHSQRGRGAVTDRATSGVPRGWSLAEVAVLQRITRLLAALYQDTQGAHLNADVLRTLGTRGVATFNGSDGVPFVVRVQEVDGSVADTTSGGKA